MEVSRTELSEMRWGGMRGKTGGGRVFVMVFEVHKQLVCCVACCRIRGSAELGRKMHMTATSCSVPI